MKNLMIALTVALSATFASANQDLNIKKVNKVTKEIVGSIQTDVIQKVEVKFDEKSNLDSAKTLKTGVIFSANAKEAAWTKSNSTIIMKASAATLTSDAAHSKVQMGLNVGSRTKAVALYSFAAAEWLKSSEEHPVQNENEQAFRVLLADAAKTTELSQIPAQLERLVVIVKTAIATQDNTFAGLEPLFNSLVVDTKVQGFKTTQVILKTTSEVAVDFFGAKLLISDVALAVTEGGLDVGVKVAATVETTEVEELLAQIKGFLVALQSANAEQIAELKDTAQAYAEVASEMIKGE